MSDMPSPEQGNGEAEGPSETTIRVLAHYVKDLSFENPRMFAGQGTAPQISVGVDLRSDAGPPEQHIYSLDLKLSVRATLEDQVVFIVELTYTGIFQVQAASPDLVSRTLLIDCPVLLLPHATLLIGEMTRQGGHPPLIVDRIDFADVYRQQRAAEAEARGTSQA